MSLPRIAVSIGDPNGVGPEIALRAHDSIRKICRPVYCADHALMVQASILCGVALPEDFETSPLGLKFDIVPGTVSAEAGRYSHASFVKAISLTENGETEAVLTLPIHKEAWMKAGIAYKGHTDMLRDHFKRDAIMMLGCSELYVALFTEHIPLNEVAPSIRRNALARFLVDFYQSTGFDDITVLGLNPHAGDNGVLGNEEEEIVAAIGMANGAVADALKCNGWSSLTLNAE